MVQKLLCFITDRNWSMIIFPSLITVFWRRFGIKAVVAKTGFSKLIVLKKRLNKTYSLLLKKKETQNKKYPPFLKCDCQKKNNWFYLIFKETRSGGFKTFRWLFWQCLPAPTPLLWVGHQISACTAGSVYDVSVFLNCSPAPQPQLQSSHKNSQCKKNHISENKLMVTNGEGVEIN